MSPILGGRSEVLAAPFYELLAHLEMLKEQKKNERFGEFLNIFYANPMTNKDARKKYINDIKPESEILQRAKKGGALVTDLDQLRLIKQMQDQEAAALKKFSKGG